MAKNIQKLSLLLLTAIVLNGCIMNYRVDPERAWQAAPQSSNKGIDKLYYKVDAFSSIGDGGYEAMLDALQRNPLGIPSERASDKRSEGYFIDTEVKHVDPSVGSMVWTYVSYALLFLLPSYSGSSGFQVSYTVFKDGQALKSYHYDIDRTMFAWLPVLPFAWINFMTKYESDAFKAITRQFFEEAQRDQIL